jgi:hypothetical protein
MPVQLSVIDTRQIVIHPALAGSWFAAQGGFFGDCHTRPNLERELKRTQSQLISHWSIAQLFPWACCLLVVLSGCGSNSSSGTNSSGSSDKGTLVPSLSNVTFSAVSVGEKVTTKVSLLNQGPAAVEITQLNVTGHYFSVSGQSVLPATVAAGESYSLTVAFVPTTAGAITGQITITSDFSTNGTVEIGLSGTGTSTSSPAVLSNLTCTGDSISGSGTDTCTVTLDEAAASGGMSVSLASSSTSVKVPTSVTVSAKATSAEFTATAAAVTTAQKATLTASAGSISKTFTLQLNVAVPTLSINATTIAFGDVLVKSPATQSVTLTSSGTAAVTISAPTLKGTGFSISGVTFPITLNPGKAATLDVVFDPTAAGAETGQLTITSNSSTNSTVVIGLSGTGELTGYSVSLSWDAPSDSTEAIEGYNVYRSPSSGASYQLLNSAVDTKPAYVDSTVQDGASYDYIVESVSSSGAESAPSNVFSVNIP